MVDGAEANLANKVNKIIKASLVDEANVTKAVNTTEITVANEVDYPTIRQS